MRMEKSLATVETVESVTAQDSIRTCVLIVDITEVGGNHF